MSRIKTSTEIEGRHKEIYGNSLADRPLIKDVDVGTTFVLITTVITVYVSNGTEWVEV